MKNFDFIAQSSLIISLYLARWKGGKMVRWQNGLSAIDTGRQNENSPLATLPLSLAL